MDPLEYISDSDSYGDGDSNLITPLLVSNTRIRRVLSKLPGEEKERITTSLQKSGYGVRHIYHFQQHEQNQNNELNNEQTTQVRDRQPDADDTSIEQLDGASPDSFSPSRTYNIDELFSDITYASQEGNPSPKILRASQVALESEPSHTATPPELLVQIDDPDETENANHLRAYLGSKQSIYSRRGLRDRSFANAHPYLADSAHWMGLADIETLNDLYKENRDVELIVKMLNQKYLRNKRLYPREEKYKWKNFYSLLSHGKGSGAKSLEQQQEESQNQSKNEEQLELAQNESQKIGSSQHYLEGQDVYTQSDNEYHEGVVSENITESMGLLEQLSQPDHIHNTIQMEEDLFNFSQNEVSSNFVTGQIQTHDKGEEESDCSDESESEAFVQVGGRLLKEKSILHGALPESTKRLSIYKPKKKILKKTLPRVIDYRKGLAVKKNGSRSFSRSSELTDFVDSNHYFDGDDTTYNLPLPYSRSNLDVSDNNIFKEDDQNLLKASRSLSTSEDSSDSGLSEGDHLEEPTNIQNSFDWEVIEEDKIDPMFANSEMKRSKSSASLKKRRLESRIRPRHQRMSKKSITSVKRKPSGELSRQAVLFGGAMLGFSRLSRNVNTMKTKNATNFTSKRTPLSEITSKVNKIQRDRKHAHKSDLNVDANKLLKSGYEFSRNPVISTVSIEVDSERNFMSLVHPSKKFLNRRLTTLPIQLKILSDSLQFPKGLLLAKFHYSRLDSLKNGYTKLMVDGKDSIFVSLFGKSYSFSLLDKESANENTLKLLRQLSRIISDTRIALNPSLEVELYNSITGLIEWYLILQELPNDDICWQILYKVCHDYGVKGDNLLFYPYFILLLHVWIQIGIGSGINPTKYSQNGAYFSKFYFKLVFENMTVEELHKKIGTNANDSLSVHFESLYIIYLIENGVVKSDSNNWWSAIDEGLKSVKGEPDPFNTLDIIYFLSTNFTPPPRGSSLFWNPFYTFYASLGRLETNSTSLLYDKFLEMVFLLKDQYSCPIEEKLITLIYSSTITVRKFANFSNEIIQPELIGKLLTRDSIPDTSFFERFMYLLFSFVSELPVNDVAKKRRLISKLFTSSHFIYKSDSKYLAMYVNRLNFILLLSQLSNKINLKGQILDLILRIEKSDDLSFYAATCEGLNMYSEIVSNDVGEDDQEKLPLESYSIMIERLGDLYKRKKFQECLVLWDYMKSSIDKWSSNPGVVLLVYANIELLLFEESMMLEICHLILANLKILEHGDKLLLRLVYENNFNLLQTQVGRLPIADDLKVSSIIEVCIKVWIISSVYLDPDINWNELIFQKYPYMGNSYLRDKFKLFFYSELLNFLDLSSYLDTYLILFLQTMIPGSSFEYEDKLFNTLRNKTGGNIFFFNNEIPTFELNKKQFINYRYTILDNLIQNIVTSAALTEQSKGFYIKLYVNLLLKHLSEASSRLHSDTHSGYIRNVEILLKYGLKFIKDDGSFEALTRKLGLLKFQVDAYAWFDLSLKSKLTIVHAELVRNITDLNSINHSEVFALLDKFTRINGKAVDFVYHLISIYSKAIVLLQNEKWTLLSILLEYLTMKLKTCQVNLRDRTFKQFISLLTELGYLKRDSTSPYFQHQLLSLNISAQLLHTSYYIYDGYKDQAAFKDDVLKFIENYNENNYYTHIDDFIHPFSPLRPFDISTPSNEIKELPHQLEKEIEEPVLATSITNLIQLVSSTYSTTGLEDPTNEDFMSINRTTLQFEL